MPPLEPSPQTTLAILLGASKWPLSSLAGSPAFKGSADKVKDYFCNSHLFGLPSANWLDLFDTNQSSPDEVDRAISDFLDRRIRLLEQAGTPARDLLFYYIGHGLFAFDSEQAYHLAILSTRDANIGVSAIAMASLAYTLKTKARYLRRIVILDCCFAAKSFKYMQSAPDQAAIEQTKSAFEENSKGSGFPQKGTALFCSSGHTTPSLILENESGTMFSEAIIRALSPGETHQLEKPYFSLYDLKQLTIDNLKILAGDHAPRPEVHSPDQSNGDVADVPFFPNLHIAEGVYEEVVRKRPPQLQTEAFSTRQAYSDANPHVERRRVRHIEEERSRLKGQRPRSSRHTVILLASLALFVVLTSVGGYMYRQATITSAPATASVGNTFHNPITPNADPFVTHANGNYYLTGTTTGGALQIWHGPNLESVGTTAPTTVWSPSSGQPTYQIWSPSLFLLPYQGSFYWFLYFTASSDNSNEGHQIYVLQSSGTDPLGPYTFKGKLVGSANTTTIDPSILQIGNQLFILSVEEIGANVTYIAPLSDPLTERAAPTLLITPNQSWEKGSNSGQSTYGVAEGPEALYHDGKIFIVYSASDTGDSTYCLGLLTYNGSNPLLSNSWTKAGPVFQYSSTNGVYGPGRASFTTSPDGTQDWMVYQAKASLTFTYEGRTTRAQSFGWNADGSPNFGIPASTSSALAVPSGEAPLTYHDAFAGDISSEWTTHGGNWSTAGGVYSDSNMAGVDQGLTGSTTWTDYTFQADMRLHASSGRAGIIARVSQAGGGTDTYTGYYLDVDIGSGQLVLGKFNKTLMLLGSDKVAGGVQANKWYHLTLQMNDCTLVAGVQAVDSSRLTSFVYRDTGCTIHAGMIGVHDVHVATSWRNITVTPGGATTTSFVPYEAPLAGGSTPGWTTYGGNWSVANATYSDSAGFAGDKAIASAISGSDYTLQADVQVAANGNAGLILHVTNPIAGTDAYSGYFVGLDVVSGQLLLGRANNGWVSLRTVAVPGGVTTNTWYHLTAQIAGGNLNGCMITAVAQSLSSTNSVSFSYFDTACTAYQSGAIGVRTVNTPASWENLVVTAL